ncbi:MAG: hypothetical protein LAQ30_11145, partial [Acidobacteriia bacterium]|nr:hypothetical protein [Terriglobia bacterium]
MSVAPSRAQNSDSPGGPSYMWEVPGKPVTVRISLDVIDRLEREAVENFRSISSRGSEIGGVLLGDVSEEIPACVSIEDYEPIPCDYNRGPLYHLSDADLGRFDAAMERRAAARGLRVLGFYRSHTRKGLCLDAEDMILFNTRFSDPRRVALLVRPYATKPSVGAVFIWENGQVRGDASYQEFPFQSAQLASARGAGKPGASGARGSSAAPGLAIVKPPVRAPSRLEIAPPEPPAPRPPAVPEATAPPTSPEPPKATPAASLPEKPPAAAPPRAGQAVAPVDRPVKSEAASPADPGVPASPAEESAAPAGEATARTELPPAAAEPAGPAPRRTRTLLVWGAVAAALLACSGMLFVYPGILRHSGSRPLIPLTLRVEHSASDLLLTWNRDSDAIRSARRAMLQIFDGERHENIDMNLNDLRNGSIVYSPLTADVSFRMEITGADQSKIASESVRVLRTRPSPMPQDDGKPAQASAAPMVAAGRPTSSRTASPCATRRR